MRITAYVYYRRVIIDGLSNLPKEGPVIVASNHPNSFLDAILLGCYLPRSLHFIARSDVFNAPWKRWILHNLQMIPIYRLQEGIENLDKNKETFQRCYDVLRRNSVINIYAEGICVQEKRLRKLKKGTARIALEYVSQYNAPLAVVAVGLNYMEPRKFRKELIIGVSQPFNALEFKEEYKQNPAVAINAFNELLTRRFRTQVIHIEDRQQEAIIDKAILQFRKKLNFQHGFLHYNTGVLDQLIAFTNKINEGKIVPSASTHPRKRKRTLMSALLAVGKLPGVLINGLPVLAAMRLTKSKVRLNEFKDSVLIASAMIFSLLYAIVIFLISVSFSPTFAVVFLIAMAFSAWLAIRSHDMLNPDD